MVYIDLAKRGEASAGDREVVGTKEDEPKEHDWHPGDDPSGLGVWCTRCGEMMEDVPLDEQDGPCPGRE